MKYFFIFLILIGFIGFSAILDNSYALWIRQSPQELLEQSQMIFVGNITSVNILEFEKSSTYYIEDNGIENPIVEHYTLSLDEYTVDVEEFIKNSQDHDLITIRQPTISSPGRVIPYGGFDVGDRVLFYAGESGETNTYFMESFKIPTQCDTDSVVHQPRIIGTDSHMQQHGIQKQDNFTTGSPITFVFERDTSTLFGKSFEVEVFLSKQVDGLFKDRIFSEKISAGSEPCEWIGDANFEFTLGVGRYLLNGNISDEGSIFSFSEQFSVFLESPLKQFRSGIMFDDLLCKTGLERTIKINDFKRFYCISPDTKQTLIERGWAFDESKACRNTTDCSDSGITLDKTVYPEPKRTNLYVLRSLYFLSI